MSLLHVGVGNLGKAAEQIGGPVEPGQRQPMPGKIFRAMLGQSGIDALLARGIGCCAQRERDGAKTQFEQPVAAG